MRSSGEVHPREHVERALQAIVWYEAAAARSVAQAFGFQRSSAEYLATLAEYRLMSAERLAAERVLRAAVGTYVQQLRREGVSRAAAVHELATVVSQATKSELPSVERTHLRSSVVRWVVQAYDVTG